MEQSVFERLASQFSELNTVGGEVDIIKIQEAMRTAGKAFFHAVSTKKISLSEIRSLLKKEPKKTKKKTGKRLVVWDLYWWETIAWLSKKYPDSGIIYAVRTKRLKPKKWSRIYSLKNFLVTKEQLSTKKLNNVCYDLAKASETACLYLASLTQSVKKTKSGNRGRSPKYSDKQLGLMQKMHDELYADTNDSAGTWNKVAKYYGAKTGDAARIACAKYRKKLKTSK